MEVQTMKKILSRLTIMLGLIAASLLITTPALAQSLRCGVKLVMKGDTKSEVLSKCGPPIEKGERAWTYERWGKTTKLRFANGKVTTIEDATARAGATVP
jgi:Protein of unknown function (DUF2845)